MRRAPGEPRAEPEAEHINPSRTVEDMSKQAPREPHTPALGWSRAGLGLAMAAGGGAVGLAAAAWKAAAALLDPARAGDPYTLPVLALNGDTVTLPATADTEGPGLCMLQWPGGYGLLGPAAVRSVRGVERALSDRRGLPLNPGMRTRIRRHTFEGDPARAFGMAFEEIGVPTPLGSMPAWLVPCPQGAGGTWVVVVHGRGGTMAGMLRLLPALHALGLTALVISYRNDAGAPASRDRLFHLGDTEWLDLEAAVHEASRRGAAGVVAAGDSMGGAIVLQFLARSPIADRVHAVVLDSPVLDWRPVLDLAAAQHRLAPGVLPMAKRIAAARASLSWDRLDMVSRAAELTVPVLIVHGDADDVVPVATSDAFAAARPDLVTYVRLPGVGHVDGWITRSEACEAALRSFMEGGSQVRALFHQR